jgi:hypothetical protein
LEHFKKTYDNKAFTLSDCWSVLKDSKKLEDSFAHWQELENKKGRTNGNTSTGDVIDVDTQGPCVGNPEGTGRAADARKRRPPGHKATKADIAQQAGSLAFQETFKELMTKKVEATAEREERWRRDKDATTKSFIDFQERSVATDEAIAKARLLKAKVKTKALEAEAKARLLEAEARTKLLETEATTKLLEAQAMLMAEETKIMLNRLGDHHRPRRREWLENMQKTIWARQA